MNIQNFSDEFDTLISAFNNRQTLLLQDPLAFSEYEKSVFLTKAQEEIVLAYYSGQNSTGESFDETEQVKRYLASLIKDVHLEQTQEDYHGMNDGSQFFNIPEDLWFITYESVKVSSDDCHDKKVLDVVPVTQDEYHKIKRNPFRGVNGRRALRLDFSQSVVEIICKYQITEYYLRYISKLQPIILIDLPDGLSIDGVDKATECKLHEALHRRILERAVAEAISSKAITQPTDNREQQQR